MIKKNEINTKFYYRFIEFTSKMLGYDLTHERFKLICLDKYKAETIQELEVKHFAESYLYLLNNLEQSLDKSILKRTYYLLTNEMLEEKAIDLILKKYYQYYDESEFYLSSLIHYEILKLSIKRKVELAFMLSNYIVQKRNKKPLIPYEHIHEKYNSKLNKLNLELIFKILLTLEVYYEEKEDSNEINKEDVLIKLKIIKSIIKNKYGVEKLYLYGSICKEITNDTSDCDFLVVMKENILNYERLELLEELKEYLKDKLNLKVDLIDFTHALKKLDISEMENIITII